MKVRLTPGTVRVLAHPVTNALARSWRFRVHAESRLTELVAGHTAFVYLLWHEALLPLVWRHRSQRVAIVVSEGREGRYLADYASSIGYQLVQGSSTRGAARALLGAIRCLGDGISVGFTPDGPLGPRREVKPGVVRAAQRTGAPILPMHAVARSAWRLASWDEMMVPKPFAVVDIRYGEPFTVEPGPEGFAAGMARCACALQQLTLEMEG
ncbi:MAG TPA: lysophospholipid acyltransferase family protein [Gemmatimonadales bacterium]|jgi:hypothetical protein|nr:lysophospholipid acyltransferase family protein [Gemmatimonadales bacterium]